MNLRKKLTYLIPSVRRRADQDIDEELRSLRDLAAPGELGNLTLAAEDARGALSWLWFERLVQDLRYAARSLAHHQAFTALVVVSLALGMGANTAVFSFMDSILLRPLPVPNPHSLALLRWRAKNYTLASSGMMWSTDGSRFDETTGTLSSIFPYAALGVFQKSDDVVAGAFGYFSANRLALTAGGLTESVKGQYVTGGYFAGMGVTPVAGRLIQPADDDPATAAVVVLSQRVSRGRFGTALAAIGQTVRLNDKPFTVIGVVPEAFFGAEPGAIPDAFMPMHADSVLDPSVTDRKYKDEHLYWLEIMTRLKPGVTITQAQSALGPRFRRFVEATATTDKQRQDLPALVVESGATGLDSLRHKYAQPIYVLMTMVGLILLIACSNIANLLLSRAASRRREIAVRLSIGASRSRLIRQLLTESVLLSALGGVLGVGVAWWGIGVLTSLLANGRDNFTLHAALNWTVLGVTCALSVVTGLLFGLAPALQATRVDVVSALKEVRANDAPRRWRGIGLSQLLVVTQIVFSLVLLVGAGLFGRTLMKLHAIELGFDRENVLLFTLRPGAVGYQGPALFNLYEDLRARLRAVPGALDVSLSAGALPMGGGTMTSVGIVGARPTGGDDTKLPDAVVATVGPTFFRTMHIPIRGRDFTEQDNNQGPKVVVVNQRLAALFGVPNPIGRTLTLGRDQFEIVGAVDDALIFTLKEDHRPIAYFPYQQASRAPYGMVYEIRTARDPMGLASAMREAVRQTDVRLAVSDVKSQAVHVDQAISSEITLSRLCTVFSGLALVIACVGLYGMVAFNVSRRTNEIGIRMTLGARRGRIVWMVLQSVLVMTLAGLAIGVPLALAGSTYVKSLLFGIEPTDAASLAMAIGVLFSSGLVAGWIPARRAARISPMAAIRHE
jgi:macrolide transport system ATP-binding/permease protein